MEPFVAEYLSWLERDNKWLFHRLLEYSSSMKNRLKVSFFFNAYQPRCNRLCRVSKQRLPDNINPFFHELYEEINSTGIERKETDNLIAIATTDCYLPLLIIGERFPGSLSIAFPQVTLDEVRNRFPSFVERLHRDYREGKVDLGISSYHHSFAPLLNEKLLFQEYSSSLASFISSLKIVREMVSLHIPECAISPSLMDALASVQNLNHVSFVTALDSDYHNINGYYDIGKINKVTYPSRGSVSSINILFSNNHFSRKLFSFPPNSDPKDVGFWYFTRLFESVAKPQPYPYWEKMKNGETVRFTIHTDAETIGFYVQERIYSLYLMLHLMKNFDISFSPLSMFKQDELVERESIEPSLYRTWDMETNGTTNRWMKKDFDSSTQFFFIAREIFPYLLEELSGKESEMDNIERKRLWIAKVRWANALTSCPHWWSDQNHITKKQFVRDVLESGKQIRELEKHIRPERKEVLLATKRLEDHPFVKRVIS